MEPLDNPLLIPRAIWQTALIVTLLLIALRIWLYFRRRGRPEPAEAEPERAKSSMPDNERGEKASDV